MTTFKKVLVGSGLAVVAVAGLAAWAMFGPEAKGKPIRPGTKIRTRKGKVLTVASHDGGSQVYVREEPGRYYNPWQFAVLGNGLMVGRRRKRPS